MMMTTTTNMLTTVWFSWLARLVSSSKCCLFVCYFLNRRTITIVTVQFRRLPLNCAQLIFARTRAASTKFDFTRRTLAFCLWYADSEQAGATEEEAKATIKRMKASRPIKPPVKRWFTGDALGSLWWFFRRIVRRFPTLPCCARNASASDEDATRFRVCDSENVLSFVTNVLPFHHRGALFRHLHSDYRAKTHFSVELDVQGPTPSARKTSLSVARS